MKYTGVFSKKVTPQSLPIPGKAIAQNNAGGYAFAVDDWVRMGRFLILGSEGGTYYVGERKLSRDNAEALIRCVQADGTRAVSRIVEISDSGRAPKNGPAVFALAIAASMGSDETRALALAALQKVARTGTHLFEFVEYATGMRGWGRGLRSAVARWYVDRPPRDLAYQAVKYQQHEGWSNRDLLRLVHAKAPDEQRNAILHWAVKGWPGVGDEPHPDEALRLIWAYEKAKGTKSEAEVAGLIRDYRLPREAVPTQWLTQPQVWDALLADMPITAMIRNLGTMSKVGLLATGSAAERSVVQRLGDVERLRKARVHPIALLSAMRVYRRGRGVRSDATWTPCESVGSALEDAFYAAFKTVEPTGKRHLLALDVSGSMGAGEIAGVPGLAPRDASAAMALVTANVEKNWQVVGFTAGDNPSRWTKLGLTQYGAGISPLNIAPGQRLNEVARYISELPFGGTDCALPMIWALKNKLPIDVFVVYTDSETWAGKVHPVQALARYRDEMGIPAKLVIVGMTATEVSIADPDDAGMLDVVGFDTAAPQLMADFARGA